MVIIREVTDHHLISVLCLPFSWPPLVCYLFCPDHRQALPTSYSKNKFVITVMSPWLGKIQQCMLLVQIIQTKSTANGGWLVNPYYHYYSERGSTVIMFRGIDRKQPIHQTKLRWPGDSPMINTPRVPNCGKKRYNNSRLPVTTPARTLPPN